VEHWVEFDAASAPIEAAAALVGDRGAPTPSRLVLPSVVYCVTADEAANAVEAVVRDAMGRPIGLDIETAASPAEMTRLKALTLSFAAAKGKLAGLRKAKASPPDIKTAAKDAKTIDAGRKMAGQAALDPHRSSIRLVQLYGGGDKVYVVDIARTGQGALRLLNGLTVVAHNAQFELTHLEHTGVELDRIHCTLQAARLLLGERRMKLADAAADYLGVALDKDEQTSDWGAPNLTWSQLEYAAADAVTVFCLAQKMLPTLGRQTSAYEIQLSAVPAVARMELRGFRLDVAAHSRLVEGLEGRVCEAETAYIDACLAHGRDDLADAGLPKTPREKERLLETLLPQDELDAWERTPRNAALSTKRTELQRAAPDCPPIAALIEVVKLAKLAEDFGPTLAARVSSVTGRIHASYRVAGTNTGRATCRQPNLQQIPRTSECADFRALFVPEPGNVLIVADYSSMELRAAAAISGDRTMTEAFRRGDDLHTITAARVSGKRPEDVTKAERQAAKATNFGSIYGIGPYKLTLSAWAGYGVKLSIDEARARLRAFEASYPGFVRWRNNHYQRCVDRRCIVIGRDAARGVGRLFPKSRLKQGRSFYTTSANLPVQGACADAAMLALAYVDERLFEAGIDGGPVAWLHDEIVVEVCVEDADRAVEIVKQSMIDGFAETFPGAPLNGLVEPHIGMNWGTAKGGEKRTATVATPEPNSRLVYETHVKLIRGDFAGGSTEPELRAIEHTVFAYRRDYPNASLEAAKTAVLAAIKRSSMRKAPAP
jgi:DNA polymerase I